MNMKKLLYGFLTIGILSGAACTTDNDEAYEVSSIDRKKVVTGPNKQAIDRKKVVTGPNKQAIDRKKVVTGPNKKS